LRPEQFQEFLKYSKGRMEGLTDLEKIRLFMDWCKRKGFASAPNQGVAGEKTLS
jgi:hypothetical protein